jgi:hypothetical protein
MEFIIVADFLSGLMGRLMGQCVVSKTHQQYKSLEVTPSSVVENWLNNTLTTLGLSKAMDQDGRATQGPK